MRGVKREELKRDLDDDISLSDEEEEIYSDDSRPQSIIDSTRGGPLSSNGRKKIPEDRSKASKQTSK